MNRRDFMRVTGAGVLAAGLPRLGWAADGPDLGMATNGAKRPNILLIMTDQQHAGMMSCAGNLYVKTPAMDSLAANGMRFERAYCANPVCMPSRFSMLTGLMPSRIGLEANKSGFHMPAEIVTNGMGNVFRRAGYRAFYNGKYHVTASHESMGFEKLVADKRIKGQSPVVQFLRQPQDKPFLLVASFENPHDICFMAINAHKQRDRGTVNYGDGALGRSLELPPGVTREEFFARICPPLPANFEIPEGEPSGAKRIPAAFTQYVRENWTDEQWRMHRWAYARLTESVDAEIGEVLIALREAGLEENTLVIFVSDHGDMDASHRLEHKSVLYEESVRVPFLVSWKGVTQPGRVDGTHLVSTGLDLIPTMCDFAGIPAPKELKGRSVRSLAEGKENTPWRETLVTESEGARMLRSARYKYVRYRGKEEQLMDLETDPGEMRNLATDPKSATVLEEHRRLLKEWYAENGETWSPK
ncbi:MAG: DUF4976 domain-containing protein [Lentisphaerae bacterium]|nr:DUF4976 domain-containing protein [Lentisphaerota bacterium]